MSFLAPLWLAAAGATALGVLALHFITTQRPPASPLPTARFVPAGDARASSRAARPTDLLLLLLRIAAVMLLGAAFAGPVVRAAGVPLGRVIVVDRSRSALPDTRDSSLALIRADGRGAAGDVVILFDSSATAIAAGAGDSLQVLAATRRHGSLSAALVSARRAAGGLALHADSIELVLVSPLTADEIDAATAHTVARWPGRVRLVRTAAAKAAQATVTIVPGAPDDLLAPVVAALNGAGARDAAHAIVRVIRGAPTAADSAAARSGASVVEWPQAVGAPHADGVWAGTATLVAPLVRLPVPSGGRVVARWADGAVAAAEWTYGAGCVRAVGIGVPAAGDISLQPAFMGVARTLLAPCDGAAAVTAISDSAARSFGKAGAAATAESLRAGDDRSALAPWLLAAALALLAGELVVRRGASLASA